MPILRATHNFQGEQRKLSFPHPDICDMEVLGPTSVQQQRGAIQISSHEKMKVDEIVLDNHYTSEEVKERIDSVPTTTTSPDGGNEVAGEIKLNSHAGDKPVLAHDRPHMFMKLAELEHKLQQFYCKICRVQIGNAMMAGLTDKDPVAALAKKKKIALTNTGGSKTDEQGVEDKQVKKDKITSADLVVMEAQPQMLVNDSAALQSEMGMREKILSKIISASVEVKGRIASCQPAPAARTV